MPKQIKHNIINNYKEDGAINEIAEDIILEKGNIDIGN
ncbi:hypothetical protein SDC9_184035 [bioreactor metagenome]|uniref:Uncharacterized protein n=1 Tax=bioreactor metagenome TaxID=1076179 RepID=A0A645HDC0_9ZZZZ